MNVSKLYIGDIRKITKVEKVESNPAVYKSELVRRTIFLKTHDGSKTVKDIIYGGRYRIGNYKANLVGKKYAVDLDRYPIEHNLRINDCSLRFIGKRKLLKIMKNNLNK